MNGLSWLLYASEVSGRVGFASGLLATLAGLLLVFAVIALGFLRAMAESDDDFDHPPKSVVQLAGSGVKWAAVSLVVFTGLSWFLPTKNTLMLIAASEVGQTVLASKDVQAIGGEAGALATDSLKLLRKYVTEQLGEGKAE